MTICSGSSGKMRRPSDFTILVDDMLSALDRQNIPVSIREFEYSVLLYNRKDMPAAIHLAMDLRSGGDKVECICMEARVTGPENTFPLRKGRARTFGLRSGRRRADHP